MKEIFERYNITLNEEQLKKFDKYYRLLVHYNSMFNLTAIIEREQVYKKHFVDSLLGVDNLTMETLIDVGSGGGFPAIPLKIVNPNIKLTLLEATGKKCEFLKTVVSELDLKEVTVINGRAEDYAKNPDFREKFDHASARAVARLNTLLEYCLPFIKVGGSFISYKANAKEEIAECDNALKVLGGSIQKVKEYTLDDANRSIIIVKKEKTTPPKYPRGKGKERKNPL